MGKARPWMLYGYIGCAVTLVAILQYLQIWENLHSMPGFFIAYTLLNAVFLYSE